MNKRRVPEKKADPRIESYVASRSIDQVHCIVQNDVL